ncbi:MAG: HupE/UreJ family protein [Kiloniellaceae bacterium]
MKRFAATLALLLATTGPALAHTPIAGIGSFYNGLLHPVLVPAHLLILVATGLLLGQQATVLSRWGWGTFVAAFWIGLAAGQLVIPTVPAAALLVVALTAGLLVAFRRPIGLPALAGLAALGGFGMGLDSLPGSVSGRDTSLTLAGTAIGGVLLLSYAGGLASRTPRAWHCIGVRIAGSWIAAAAGIVLAFTLTGIPVTGQG